MLRQLRELTLSMFDVEPESATLVTVGHDTQSVACRVRDRPDDSLGPHGFTVVAPHYRGRVLSQRAQGLMRRGPAHPKVEAPSRDSTRMYERFLVTPASPAAGRLVGLECARGSVCGLRGLHRGTDPGVATGAPVRGFHRLARRSEPKRGRDILAEPPRRILRSHEHVVGRSPGTQYARRFRSLSAELTADLGSLARDRGLTLNAVLLGGLAIALGRHAGKADVAIGVVAAGRPPVLEGVEAMVGMFINTLVLRIEIDEGLAVGQWLTSVQDRQAGVLEHEHSAMTEVQKWSGLGAGTTLTDTLFAYWNFGGNGGSSSQALTYRTVDGYGRTSFPFAVTVESSDPINIGLDFDQGEFDEVEAACFLDHYATLLASIVASPDAPVSTLTMLTDGERQDLADYNDTTRPVPFASVIDAFRAQVESTSAEPAVVCGAEVLSYAELDAMSERLATRIIRVGRFNAKRVALYLPRSPDMVAAMLGVLKAGAAYVPVDRHLPRQRVAYLLEDSGADLVVTTPELRSRLPSDVANVITLPLADSDDADLDFDIPTGPGDLAYVMYTSGSTGRPKGVMVTHQGLVNYVWWARGEYGDHRPVSFPLHTSSGFDLTVTSIYVPLVSGGAVAIYPDDDDTDPTVLAVFEQDQVDVVKLTPSHLAVLEDRHLKTERIRTLIVGGEDLRADLARSVYDSAGDDLAIFNEYGPTEATVGCMIHRFDPHVDTIGSVPIGRPVANSRVYLLDGGLAHVPVGQVGELYVAGDGLASGYLNQAKLTARGFIADPFRPDERMYRAGDLARWRSPGVMEFVGRTDDQIKVRGHRIELGEIEAVLIESEAVANAAVAVREPSPGDIRLVAYYVADPGVGANVTQLRQHLRDRLPDHMVPRHLVRVDALPLTTNGKLDRQALPEVIGEVVTSTAFLAPRTHQERLVARLCAELLDVEQVSVADNFFELGGHSILAMQLIARLHAETGVRLSPRVILLNTLSEAAAQLPETTSTDRAAEGRSQPWPTPSDTIATSAFFFGPVDQPLFGMHHTPSGRLVQNRAALLCAPLGWEYMRTHWAMRKIARLLAIGGFHVLRFDYFGTGDSSGRSSEATVERWLDDIAEAAAELRAGAGVEKVSVVGVRLGASLAALACSRGLAVDRLVMWDPVVEGRAHVSTLRRMHAEMIAGRPKRRVTPEMEGDELLGFPYPAPRLVELESIDLARMAWPAVATTLVASQPLDEYRRLVDAIGVGASHDLVEDATAWDDLASSQTSLLPARVPGHIVRVLGGES